MTTPVWQQQDGMRSNKASARLDCLGDCSCSLWWLSTVVNDVLSLNQGSVLQTDRSHQSGMDLSFPSCAGHGSSLSGHGHRNWVRVSRCIPLCGMSVTQPEDATVTLHPDLYNQLDLLVYPMASMAEVFPLGEDPGVRICWGKLWRGKRSSESWAALPELDGMAWPELERQPRSHHSCATHLSAARHH